MEQTRFGSVLTAFFEKSVTIPSHCATDGSKKLEPHTPWFLKWTQALCGLRRSVAGFFGLMLNTINGL